MHDSKVPVLKDFSGRHYDILQLLGWSLPNLDRTHWDPPDGASKIEVSSITPVFVDFSTGNQKLT